ncbi:hypothetical protein NQ314_007431, partial [Rhamnusium bicolor]
LQTRRITTLVTPVNIKANHTLVSSLVFQQSLLKCVNGAVLCHCEIVPVQSRNFRCWNFGELKPTAVFIENKPADWISHIKVKKLNFKIHKRKNLFIEAVLNKALSKAETELRQKQEERRLRWQHLKSRWGVLQDCCDNTSINWDTKICEELNNSLDNFMLQLKEVKVPIQR